MLVIAGSVLFYTFSNRKNNFTQNINNGQSKDSVNHSKDTIPVNHELSKDEKQLLAENLTLDKIGEKFYNVYKGSDEDPIEASLYLNAYRRKKYAEVLAATGVDLQTKGSADKNEEKLLSNYLLFYKSLSYTESAKPEKAVELLKKILNNNKSRNNLYYQSQWYLLMAYLKLNNKENAQQIATVILSEKNNPNREKAAQIAELINN